MSVLISINRAELDALAKRLGLVASAVDAALAEAINDMAPGVRTRARDRIVSRVRLKESYVDDRITKPSRATVNRPFSYIRARERNTRLATYAAVQRITSAPRAKGDRLRGIGKGYKQAGISTAVLAGGSLKVLSGAFLVPLRSGSAAGGNGMGIFTRVKGSSGRSGSANIKHRYGPSINQLYSRVVDDMTEPLLQELEAKLIPAAAEAMRRRLAGA